MFTNIRLLCSPKTLNLSDIKGRGDNANVRCIGVCPLSELDPFKKELRMTGGIKVWYKAGFFSNVVG